MQSGRGIIYSKWRRENCEQNRSKPWKRHEDFHASDVTGTLHIVLADGIYIDALNLKSPLQNQIRCMAAFVYELIRQIQEAGINVKLMEEIEHFAVIDQLLVWHGGMNLLGKEDAWDNLIRVKDTKAA